ncbi:hypothetical protein ACFY00_31585 [Kitasatospora sp. NPDC001540]|uniref:hypothetical protein n=1 Tax=Kitasatospora sp. NPDC001540 TaxID=3364014 RepID=UPI0036B3AE73
MTCADLPCADPAPLPTTAVAMLPDGWDVVDDDLECDADRHWGAAPLVLDSTEGFDGTLNFTLPAKAFAAGGGRRRPGRQWRRPGRASRPSPGRRRRGRYAVTAVSTP